MRHRSTLAAALAACLVSASAPASPVEKTQGVYVTLLSGLKADVGETAAKAESALRGAGFEVLASYDNGVPEGCQSRARSAAAFPIEVVVAKKGTGSAVTLLKEMWRMKLYFQDAGNWAFMKNMQMPGDIQNEIEAAVRKAVR